MNTTESDTQETPSKRSRTTENAAATSELPTTIGTTVAPIMAAKVVADAAISTLPAQVKTLATKLSEQVLGCFSRMAAFKQKQEKSSSEKFLPRSVKFNFELSAPKKVKALSQFTDLQSKANNAILTCQNALVEIVRATIDLESTILQDELDIAVVTLVVNLGKAFVVFQDGLKEDRTDTCLFLLCYHALNKIVKALSPGYKIFNTLLSFAQPKDKDGKDLSEDIAKASLICLGDRMKNAHTIFNTLIYTLVITTGNTFAQQIVQNGVARELSTLSVIPLVVQRTEETVTAIDLDLSDMVKPEIITTIAREEVRKEIRRLDRASNPRPSILKSSSSSSYNHDSPKGTPPKHKNKKLKKKQKDKNQPNHNPSESAKNLPRGASSSPKGASSKKEKTTTKENTKKVSVEDNKQGLKTGQENSNQKSGKSPNPNSSNTKKKSKGKQQKN